VSDLDRNTLWARAFMDELARCGITDVCIAPGSRSAPLVLAAARDERLRVRVHLDERSAAFFALGIGKASGRPAALVTTSGTAAANALPAVVEASWSDTPLLVLTADRPHHLRDSDANQAIDQIRLYGGYVREFFDVAPPAVSGPALRHLRGLACRAVAAAVGMPAGPVHLNFPFDKPLEPTAGTGDVPDGFAEQHPRAYGGRPDGAPYVRITRRRPFASDEDLERVAEHLRRARRGVIVAGPASVATDAVGVLELGQVSDFPVLADPLSGVRYRFPNGATVISAYDLMLKASGIGDSLTPDVIVRFGQSPTSAALLRWLEAQTDAVQIVIDGGRRHKDHLALATDYVQADIGDACTRLAARLGPCASEPPWRSRWRLLDVSARQSAGEATQRDFFEGSVLAELATTLPAMTTLFVSSSMPVRDLDAFGSARDEPLTVLANRGASGIDGIVSTALGASAGTGRPIVAVLGDLAFLHDAGGLLAARETDAAVVFVVIHNDGGGIFHLLPIREHEPAFTPYFATPHGLDLGHLAALHRLPFQRVNDRAALKSALCGALAAGGSHVIEVPSEREENRRLRAAAESAVAEWLSKLETEGIEA
jgi:2-succinyl-5-enolpyruvyl-6-hydroxy-3-cyclohexene-1-carboxylate synthase